MTAVSTARSSNAITIHAPRLRALTFRPPARALPQVLRHLPLRAHTPRHLLLPRASQDGHMALTRLLLHQEAWAYGCLRLASFICWGVAVPIRPAALCATLT